MFRVAIIQSRYNKFKSSGIHCTLMLYKSKIKARLNTDFSYSVMTKGLVHFRKHWDYNQSLLTISNDEIVYCFR